MAAKALPTLRLILSLLVGVAGMYSYIIILVYIKKRGTAVAMPLSRLLLEVPVLVLSCLMLCNNIARSRAREEVVVFV